MSYTNEMKKVAAILACMGVVVVGCASESSDDGNDDRTATEPTFDVEYADPVRGVKGSFTSGGETFVATATSDARGSHGALATRDGVEVARWDVDFTKGVIPGTIDGKAFRIKSESVADDPDVANFTALMQTPTGTALGAMGRLAEAKATHAAPAVRNHYFTLAIMGTTQPPPAAAAGHDGVGTTSEAYTRYTPCGACAHHQKLCLKNACAGWGLCVPVGWTWIGC